VVNSKNNFLSFNQVQLSHDSPQVFHKSLINQQHFNNSQAIVPATPFFFIEGKNDYYVT